MRRYAFHVLSGFVLLGVIALAAGLYGTRFGLVTETVSAQSTIQLVPVAEGLTSPLYVTHARDGSGRLFIVEQIGRIRVLPPGAASPLPAPFLDIQSKVVSGGERGLLGLAFHPQYTSNRRFFVNYTRAGDGATVVSEFTTSASDPNLALTAEKVILTIAQPFANHNGGMIEFGPDGLLYIGMGDGGDAFDPGNRAQNIEELLGKMLRIDVDTPNGAVPYSSPTDNPFFGSAPGRDEIYAVGMRNPFRFSFDRATGQLYVGDVGQTQIEEIDIVTRGANYGWRVFEGTQCTNIDPLCGSPGFTPPITQYGHTNGRCSVTGGYVYRGSRSTFTPGSYLFGDFCTGEIFLYNNGAMSLLLDTNLLISSFGEDAEGEIYVVNLGGSVFRLAAVLGAPSNVMTLSATNYRRDMLATESIVTAFGSNFSATTVPAPGGQPLPTVLAGASARVTDAAGIERLAPLYFVSPGQINLQIPPGTAAGTATIAYSNATGASDLDTVSISNVAPGLFTFDSSGSGLANAIVQRVRANGSQVYEPIAQFDQASNQYVAIPIDLGPETDQVYLAAFGSGFRRRTSLSAVAVTIGGTPAQVVYAGAQGASVGVDQTNFLLPRSLAGRGEVNLVMTVDGLTANTVLINIR
jgi:uncharacterized protein (TIGR03437 family)